MRSRVLVIIHNPILEQERGRKLSQVMGWNDPDVLTRQYIADMRESSHGIVQYEVAERIEVDGYPAKVDGFQYTDATYMACWRRRTGFHQPDTVDYRRLITQFDMLRKIEAGAIDEVWLFAFPYAGYWESTMAGRGAFWCNSPPVPHTESCRRRFVIMGFNFERDVGCMLENFGHRSESIMEHIYTPFREDLNLWHRFIRHEQTAPGRAACGSVHFAPNSVADYDWGNRRTVHSEADDWLNFPNLTGRKTVVNCSAWGHGDMRAHHIWWLQHIPHVAGQTNGVANNWWPYLVKPETVGGG